jgi:hypothetical protein
MIYTPVCFLAALVIAVAIMLNGQQMVALGASNGIGDTLKHHGKQVNVHAPTNTQIQDPQQVWGNRNKPTSSNLSPVCDCHCECNYHIPATGKPECACNCDCRPPNVPSEVSVAVPTSQLPPFDMPAAVPALAPAVANLPSMRNKPHHRPPFDLPSYLPTVESEPSSEPPPTKTQPTSGSAPLAPTTVTTYPPKPEPSPTKPAKNPPK